MKASDVMVSDVITVGPDASVMDVAEILLAHRISGVPVVDGNGDLVGIVSEGDLMRRTESGTERQRSWWLEALTGTQTLAADYVKSHARKVKDVMTRNVITASPDMPLAEIATLLETNAIKRVPIVEAGKVVGIISRANLLQALASLRKKIPAGPTADDSVIHTSLLSKLRSEPWRPSMLTVTVHDGTVDLWGIVDSSAEKNAARIAAELTPGVRSVNDYLVLRPAASGMI